MSLPRESDASYESVVERGWPRFAFVLIVILACGYLCGRFVEDSVLPMVVSGVAVSAWILLSNFRPAILTSAGLPVLTLPRLCAVTAVAGIGTGLGLPVINVSKHDRQELPPERQVHVMIDSESSVTMPSPIDGE
jgi:hypothetical protein